MPPPTPFTDPEQTFTLLLPAGVTLTLDASLLPAIRYYYWSGEKSFFSIYSQVPPGQTAQEFLDLLEEDEDEVVLQANRPVTRDGRQFQLLELETRTHVPRSRHQDDGETYDVVAHTRVENLHYQFWQGKERDISVGYSRRPDIAPAELKMLGEMLASFHLLT